MDGWTWVALVGLVFDVFGIAVALIGLDSLSRDLFPNRVLPHQAAWRWFVRKVFRRKRNAVVGVMSAALTVTVGEAHGFATRARPEMDASHAEWVAYWDSRLDNISSQVDLLKADVKKDHERLSTRIDGEAKARTDGLEQLEKRLGLLLGGDNGQGLALTFWGLSASLVGTVLAGLAGLLG